MSSIINISIALVVIFFFIAIGEIFKLKKEVRKLNKIVQHLLGKNDK